MHNIITMKTCRACLCTDDDLFQVDEHFISSYNLLTNLNVKSHDSMPKCFCQACMESVRHFTAFRNKCISSESILQEKYVNVKFDQCEVIVDIKQEEDHNLDENTHYEVVDYNVKDEIKREECVAIETEIFYETEVNPLELEDDLKLKRPKGRPKKQQVKKPKWIADENYCGLCDESFIFADDLKKHLDGHRTDECCGICSKQFENWPKLLAHRAIHSTRKHCHLCPRRFHSILRLEQHYLYAHFEEKLKEMCCDHCQKTFTCREKFTKHLEMHNVECHLCPEVFASRRLLLVHLRTHDSKKRYQCDQCEYTAVHAAVLDNHKRRRHKKFSCKTCNRSFAEAKTLKKHICKDKSKLCTICGQRIYESFKRHLLSHQDAKKYKCEKCPATYKSPLSLKVHMDRHDNNPTYACDYCGRKFYYPTTLCKHRRVHTGEKPYVCGICGKRFTGNSNLRVHMKIHGIALINKRNKEPAEVPVAEPSDQATSV